MQRQTTLAGEAVLRGMALHCGRETSLTLRPAPPDTGIVWERSDLPGRPQVRASVHHVVDTRRSTTLGSGAARFRTVEHVMAALAGSGVDNAVVGLAGEEPPNGDGSAGPYVDLIRRAGVVEQEVPRRVRRLKQPLWLSRGDQHLIALPAEHLQITYTFVSDHPVLGTQLAEFAVTPEVFAREIAPARTIGWLREVQAMQAQGLALGGSWDGAVIVGEEDVLTPMRFPNEVARHKALDLIGDLALVGAPVLVHLVAIRSGHALTVDLVRLLAAHLDGHVVEMEAMP